MSGEKMVSAEGIDPATLLIKGYRILASTVLAITLRNQSLPPKPRFMV
jgi:hypothetical protein